MIVEVPCRRRSPDFPENGMADTKTCRMDSRRIRTLRLAILIAAVAGLPGCVASTSVGYGPAEAGLTLGPAVRTEPTTFAVVDARGDADKRVHVGSFQIEVEGGTDELVWLGENVEKVLSETGIDLRRVAPDQADLLLRVRRLRIRNRDGGPYHTFTTFRGDLVDKEGTHPITAYYKANQAVEFDYTPVSRNCYRYPLVAVALEVAAKINRAAFRRGAPSSEVRRLADSLPPPYGIVGETTFLTVMRLGLSNNREAIPVLVELAGREQWKDQGWLRAAAASALGTIGAATEFPLLRSMYEGDGNVSRLAALKSIGDLGTSEARAYLDQVRASPSFRLEMIREIVSLYD
ncbi:MAG: HEAT repeat domain-containing protein [Deltaproteobacteria bacterium]|nr:HEAT repeat domain-containing protein [Deltaproteobacteria bacterium]